MRHLDNITHTFKLSPLRWSEFESMRLSTETFDLITIQYGLTVRSRRTLLPFLDPSRIAVLEVAHRLSLDGLSTKEISEELNRLGFKPRTVEKFYPKLVWAMLKKYRLRIARMGNYHIENITEKVIFSSKTLTEL